MRWRLPFTDVHAALVATGDQICGILAQADNERWGAAIAAWLLDIARRFHLEIPPQLMLILKTLVHVEGLGTDLYPELDIWSLAKPILTDWIKAQMNPLEKFKRIRTKNS